MTASNERLKAIELWLREGRSDDVNSCLKQIHEVQQLLFQECAARLEPLLQAHVNQENPSNYRDKAAMCRWIGRELSRVHLGVVCPRTGAVGALFGDPGRNPDEGRWRLRYVDRERGPTVTYSSRELASLRLGPLVVRDDGRRRGG